jgi:hypothetical protein
MPRASRLSGLSYTDATTQQSFWAFLKDQYFPSARTVEELTVPAMHFLTVRGKGTPRSRAFRHGVQALYGVVYGIKMGLKFGKFGPPAGYFDFKIAPLEGLWWHPEAQNPNEMAAKLDEYEWRLLILVPAFVEQPLVDLAKQQAAEKHPETDYSQVTLERVDEGRAIQTTHLGPYAAEPVTVARLEAYARGHGLQITGKHHEIYMNDPRRTRPENIRTVLRYAVR